MYTIRPVWRHFFWWLLLAPVVLLEIRALQQAIAIQSLDDPAQAQVVQAQVTGTRQGPYNALVSYEFTVPGSNEVYSAADFIGRQELLVAVTPDALQQARSSDTIAVLYLPNNPWINRPVAAAGNVLVDSIYIWAFFLAVDVLWLIDSFIMVRNYSRAQTAAERRVVQRFRFWRVVPQ